MKKFIYSFVTILLITSFIQAPKAHACSPVPGYQYPTVQSVLNNNGRIFIAKTLNSGEIVAAEIQNYPVIMSIAVMPTQYTVMVGNGTSCSTAFNFNSNEYYVIVTPENKKSAIHHGDLDDQFSFKYNTLAQAQDAYDDLVAGQNPNPPQPNPISYTPVGYTLKYGMRGNDVRALQQALSNLVFGQQQYGMNLPTQTPPPITVDGVYGNQTVRAVKFFQEMTDLYPIDGIAGKMTQQKLADLLN